MATQNTGCFVINIKGAHLTWQRPPGFTALAEQCGCTWISEPSREASGCPGTPPQACSSRTGQARVSFHPGASAWPPYLLKLEAFWDWRAKRSPESNRDRRVLAGPAGNQRSLSGLWARPCGSCCPDSDSMPWDGRPGASAAPGRASPGSARELTFPEGTSKYHFACRARFCCQFSDFWYVTHN